jgi:hypothetical protein
MSFCRVLQGLFESARIRKANSEVKVLIKAESSNNEALSVRSEVLWGKVTLDTKTSVVESQDCGLREVTNVRGEEGAVFATYNKVNTNSWSTFYLWVPEDRCSNVFDAIVWFILKNEAVFETEINTPSNFEEAREAILNIYNNKECPTSHYCQSIWYAQDELAKQVFAKQGGGAVILHLALVALTRSHNFSSYRMHEFARSKLRPYLAAHISQVEKLEELI